MRIAVGLREETPDDRVVSSVEWRTVVSGHQNLLLEGPQEWAAALLRHLAPLLELPVVWATSALPNALAAGHRGALILQDVAALRRDDQLTLFRWLNDGGQVISATATPLFPLVVGGDFDEALYYRLNVIRLHSPLEDTALPAAAAAMAGAGDTGVL
jgi:hypothetical protein